MSQFQTIGNRQLEIGNSFCLYAHILVFLYSSVFIYLVYPVILSEKICVNLRHPRFFLYAPVAQKCSPPVRQCEKAARKCAPMRLNGSKMRADVRESIGENTYTTPPKPHSQLENKENIRFQIYSPKEADQAEYLQGVGNSVHYGSLNKTKKDTSNRQRGKCQI